MMGTVVIREILQEYGYLPVRQWYDDEDNWGIRAEHTSPDREDWVVIGTTPDGSIYGVDTPRDTYRTQDAQLVELYLAAKLVELEHGGDDARDEL